MVFNLEETRAAWANEVKLGLLIKNLLGYIFGNIAARHRMQLKNIPQI